jgi:uncharacterized protein (DUF983 family)
MSKVRRGEIYLRWNVVVDNCSVCGVDLRKREGDCWFLYYMSTAFLTGIIVGGMLLFQPSNLLWGGITVGCAWLVLLILTIPYRKALAMAFDFIIDQKTDLRT